MTKAEWLTSVNPLQMWDEVSSNLSRRKCLLYVAECLSIVIRNHKWDAPSHYFQCILNWADGAGNLQEVTEVWAKYSHFKEEPIDWFMNMMYISARAEDESLPTESTANLFRELFGGPFRPIALAPSWLTSDVLTLATGIYANRAFDRMPILADALQDTGCDNDDILNHCRQPGGHVRGCWVIDLLLGKK